MMLCADSLLFLATSHHFQIGETCQSRDIEYHPQSKEVLQWRSRTLNRLHKYSENYLTLHTTTLLSVACLHSPNQKYYAMNMIAVALVINSCSFPLHKSHCYTLYSCYYYCCFQYNDICAALKITRETLPCILIQAEPHTGDAVFFHVILYWYAYTATTGHHVH
jgi:hypothetical protein